MILFIGINGFRNGQLNLGLAGKIKIWCEVIIGFTYYSVLSADLKMWRLLVELCIKKQIQSKNFIMKSWVVSFVICPFASNSYATPPM